MAKSAIQLERELKKWTDLFPNQEPKDIKKLLDQVKQKPDTVDKETQTEELTMQDIEKMEFSVKYVEEELDKIEELKKQEKKAQGSLFGLRVISRMLGGIKEEKEHHKTQGKLLEEKLTEFVKDFKEGKVKEKDLEKRIRGLENLGKRKESEFKKSLKIKEEEFTEFRNSLERQVERRIEGVEIEEEPGMDLMARLQSQITGFENAIRDRDEALRQMDQDKAKVEQHRAFLGRMFWGFRKKLLDLEAEGKKISKEELEEKIKEIEELKKKANEQSYLLEVLKNYRQMPVLSLTTTFLDTKYWTVDWLKQHEQKKILKLYIFFNYLFGYDSSEFRFTKQVEQHRAWYQLQEEKQKFNQEFQQYASQVNNIKNEIIDLGFIYGRTLLTPLSFCFIKKDYFNGFYSPKEIDRDNLEKMPTSSFMSSQIHEVPRTSIKNIVFPLYFVQQPSTANQFNQTVIKHLTSYKELINNEIYLPRYSFTRPIKNGEISLSFPNEQTYDQAVQQNSSDYSSFHMHFVERSSWWSSFSSQYFNSLFANITNRSTTNLTYWLSIKKDRPYYVNEEVDVCLKKATISFQITPPTYKNF